MEAVTFAATSFGPGDKPIDIQLTGPDQGQLEEAARELGRRMAEYSGVSDVDDGTASGKRQLSFELTPAGQALGLTAASVAGQVRAAVFGAEALRQQRGRNEVKVLVRLPRSERSQLNSVEDLVLRTPTGGEVPLSVAARVSEGRSYTAIDRRDGQRIVAVLNGRKRSLAIVGVMMSPEFVYAIGPGDLVPDDRRFGVFMVPYEMLAAAFDLDGIPFSATKSHAGYISVSSELDDHEYIVDVRLGYSGTTPAKAASGPRRAMADSNDSRVRVLGS